MKKIVSKFGGTSMGDLQCMTRSAQICIERSSYFVIVSATAGTTNKLLSLAQIAQTDLKWSEIQKLINDVIGRHQKMIDEFNFIQIQNSFGLLTDELISIVKGIFFLKDCSNKALDRLMSLGERISSLLFSQVLQKEINKSQVKKQVLLVDIREYLVTDSRYGQARPLTAKISEKIKSIRESNTDCVYVSQGFIGMTEDQQTTTLGRGGSDYSAAIIAEALDSTELEIWTDVAGIATTDPRICSKAQSIAEISFQEASEMATFGAKVLHPATLAPAMRKNIPVFVGSSFHPTSQGTWIKKQVDRLPQYRAIALRSKQVLLTLSTPEMLHAHGFLFNIFKVFNDHQVSVDAITTSEISVSLTLDYSISAMNPQNNKLNTQIIQDLSQFSEVKVEEGFSLVSVIGNNVNHTAGVAQRIFNCIEGINVRLICLGASRHNFCILVDEINGVEAVRRLHKGLGFESE